MSDGRVAAFIDTTRRDVRLAFRTFRRAPLVALTIVSTVALGLGLVAVAFTMFNAFMFRVDAVPDVHEMFAVSRPPGANGERPRFTREQFDALRRETSVFTDAYAEVSQVDSIVDGQLTFGTFVTGNFFQVVRVGAAMGRPLTPADDAPPAGQPVMVLSHRGWERLFARDPAILGRRLLVNGLTFEIVGVMPEDFRGLTLAPDDYWAPLSTLGRVRSTQPGGVQTAVDVVGRLKPGLSQQTARAGLAVWDTREPAESPFQRGPSDIVLEPRDGSVQLSLETSLVFAPLFFAFGLILLIGCVNVANLLLARAVARQRDFGIQLSLGATRPRIVRQLLTESLLLAFVAAAAGFAISRVVLAAAISAVMSTMAADIGDVRLWVPDADWRVTLFLVVGAGVSTVLFGLAPALSATRIEPIRTIRGEVGGDARPGKARHFLVGLQVSASALLVICAAVFLRSAVDAARFDPGVRLADTIVVQIANEPARNTIVQALRSEPSVSALAASSGPPRAALAQAGGAKAAAAYQLVSPDYFHVLDVAAVRGRTFTPAELTSTVSLAVVSETAAHTFWPGGNPVGQVVQLLPKDSSESAAMDEMLQARSFTVIGVVRDVAGLRVAPFEKAVVYVPTSTAAPKTSLIARVFGDPELARQTLLNRVTAIDPDMARSIVTMRSVARMDAYFLQVAFWLTVVLGGLALALTLSGLFSVLSYLVEQRTREIGVRMALGATTRDVTRLVLSQSIVPVGAGLVIGGGSAAGLAALLLSTPAAAMIGAIVDVFDPAAYSVSILIIIAACLVAAAVPASRAASLNPTQALRQQ